MSLFLQALGLLLAYVVGAIPTGLVIGKAFAGVDIREHGSKNIGFTNAFRVLGPKLGIPVLIIDVGKAWLAVRLVPELFAEAPTTPYVVLTAAAVLLGNMINVFLGGKGGKGVATSLGVFLALLPIPTLIAFGVFAVLLAATRYVSLGSVCAAVALPAATFWRDGAGLLFAFAAVAGAAVIVKHRANVRRLLDGTENKFGRKAAPPSP